MVLSVVEDGRDYLYFKSHSVNDIMAKGAIPLQCNGPRIGNVAKDIWLILFVIM